MTGNVEEADKKREDAMTALEAHYREAFYRDRSTSIIQAIYRIVFLGPTDFCKQVVTYDDLNLIEIEDIINVKKKVDDSIQWGERFEVITDLQDRLNEFWNQYEEGFISLPSFITRFENAIAKMAYGGVE